MIAAHAAAPTLSQNEVDRAKPSSSRSWWMVDKIASKIARRRTCTTPIERVSTVKKRWRPLYVSSCMSSRARFHKQATYANVVEQTDKETEIRKNGESEHDGSDGHDGWRVGSLGDHHAPAVLLDVPNVLTSLRFWTLMFGQVQLTTRLSYPARQAEDRSG